MIALHSLDLTLFQLLIEILATLAFGLSGLLEAARQKLDAVGVVVVAGLAAFGGGTIRDILLDRRPFFWMQHVPWLWGLLAFCILAMFFMRARHFELTERAVMWPDAIGLGLFSASGTQIALNMQMPAIVSVLMGVITAVFGGVLRDIVCNQIPRAFKDHSPYAICAFIGTWVIVIAPEFGISKDLSLLLSATLVSLLRVLTLLFGFQLPQWNTTRHKS